MISVLAAPSLMGQIGREVAISQHMDDGSEFEAGIEELVRHGEKLFVANWTSQEGGGRPLTKGTGAPLADPDSPLVFPRNFNRLSAPDANSCAGCHNSPHGLAGGGGDFVTNAFVLAQRFDFVTFDLADTIATRGALDEGGLFPTLDTIANSRSTLGMFGSGYIEMLARQMTADLQDIRNGIPPGGAAALASKGIDFGELSRSADGSWDVSAVEGLPGSSLVTGGPDAPPNLIIRPFHQAARVVSLREFSVNAFNHHHGIQATERFGKGEDPDGDGYVDEITRADVTAVSVFQATLAVPGRVIPNDPEIEAAVLRGEEMFSTVGCAQCHVPSLPLDDHGWFFSEPNPYNPPGNLQAGEAPTLTFDLNDRRLPSPRLKSDRSGVVEVPAYTDLKLHDLTDGPDDPNREVLDMQVPANTLEFFAGNGLFLTKKLWGAANELPYFHHGKFATMREAIEAHGGEATEVRAAYRNLSAHDQDCIIEFLKTLQVLPKGTKALVLDENGRAKPWPPRKVEEPRRRGNSFRPSLRR